MTSACRMRYMIGEALLKLDWKKGTSGALEEAQN